jgi:hypothetical protein
MAKTLHTEIATQPVNIDLNTNDDPQFVLTKYEPHTVSVVGVPALGVNAVRLKGGSLTEDKRQELMSKIKEAEQTDRSKSLEGQAAEDAVKEQEAGTQQEATGEPESTVEPEGQEEAEEPENEPEAVTEPESEEPEAEAEPEGEEPEGDVEPEAEGEQAQRSKGEPAAEPEVDQEGQETERAKMYTAEQVAVVGAGVVGIMQQGMDYLKKELPDADGWVLWDMMYSALYDLEDARWVADDLNWNMIQNKVKSEMEAYRSKQLEQAESDEEKLAIRIKHLQIKDPDLAKMLSDQQEANRAKALQIAEQEKQAIRSKRLEEAKDKFGPIATEENTVENMVDALIKVENLDEGVATVISKALEVAANAAKVQDGGPLGDVGQSSGGPIDITAEGYLQSRSKSLYQEKLDAGQKDANLGACRAEVRLTEEYQTLLANEQASF